MKKILLIVIVVIAIASVGFGLYYFLSGIGSSSTVNNQAEEIGVPTPEKNTSSPVFNYLSTWQPVANWTSPTATTEETPVGTLTGFKATGQITTQTAAVPHFENESYLKSLGFEPDIYLAADGPGSSVWGYSNPTTGQIIQFSYRTTPTSTNQNAPVQFDCPCSSNLSVFISNPRTSS